jgi:indolepyruvate ferredoxin oxidoreductase alpha subunit
LPEKRYVMGNEAIARGGVESAVGVVAGYPGTPATEILTSYLEYPWVKVEWSSNEKVALEIALGASLCNIRSMAVMKHNGTNVVTDFMMHLNFTGVVGGMVLMSGDDPGGLSSQNEEDTRIILRQYAHLPVFDPSSVSEARRMVKDAYDLSEQTQLCFTIRPVLRICHARSIIDYGDITKPGQAVFKDDRSRFIMSAVEVREFEGIKRPQVRHRWLNEKQATLKELMEKSPYNAIETGEGKIGLVGCGIGYAYVKEALQQTDKRFPILKLCTLPLPESKIRSFVEDLDTVIVFEELEPFVEGLLKQFFYDKGIETRVVGRSDFLPSDGEMSTEFVINALKRLGLETHFTANRANDLGLTIPVRTRTQCVGCGYRTLLHALKVVARRHKGIVTGDIGCHDAGSFPPLQLQSTIYCMGSSIPIAQGMAYAGISRPVFSVIGDSTFFHNGIIGLVNAVYHKARVVVILCDNETTAMTGFQPHPGSTVNIKGDKTLAVDVEKIGQALGIPTKIVDPYNIKEVKAALEKAVKDESASLVIARAPCFLMSSKSATNAFRNKMVYVNEDKCTGCLVCINDFGCPSMSVVGKRVRVDQLTCVKCGYCADVCPTGAVEIQ